jgi:hypothetical protein
VSKKTKIPPKNHNVYVIELQPEALKHKKFKYQRDKLGPDGRCFYVGMTGLSLEERFKNHKKGYKSNKLVQKYGLYLRPKIFEKYNPMTQDEASRMEVWLARRLRKKGHAVHQA